MKIHFDNVSKANVSTLYKWHKTYANVQKKYFKDEYKIRREKQIEDFVFLNGYKKVKTIKDNYILKKLTDLETEHDPEITIITDQKFSRYPCEELIRQIKKVLDSKSKLYLCLNRYYINIDNGYHDSTLDDNPNLAITQWLKKNLPNNNVIDLSLDYDDDGSWFTWVIPDRHFFIS
jgi:hypothetical protein